MRLSLQSLWDVIALLIAEWGALFKGVYKRPVARACWLLLCSPLLVLWQCLTQLCLALDELCFPRYHHIEIRSPVFVLGPPRSGTTYLHRQLAESSSQYATASAWELFFAASILQKKLFRGLSYLDRRMGRPLSRTFDFLEKRAVQQFSQTHPGSLKEPEEDYYALQPWLRCSGVMLAFPSWKGFRRLLPGSAEMSDNYRRESLALYRRCLQKQLYVHGSGLTLLSKNASFSSWLDLLPEFFPDARYVICMRSPFETVPSMLSTADLAQRGFFAETHAQEMHTVLLNNMRAHYQVLNDQIPKSDDGQVVVVSHQEIKMSLEAVFGLFTSKLGLQVSEPYQESLRKRAESSKTFQSRHHYNLADYEVDEEDLRQNFPMTVSTLQGEGL
ncbi:sulfotransferase [Kiritimatiellota bacterium B12222]|nr:sulfotransferase [Kiritimatiellota bacterium B12222]